MKLYISDEALLLIGLFYFPVVAWLLWRLWKLPPRLWVRLGVTIVTSLIAVARCRNSVVGEGASMRLALSILALLLAVSVGHAKEYGTYDPKRILTVSETPSGKKHGIDAKCLDQMLDDLALHAKNYPPHFDTPQDRQRAVSDVKTLSGMLDVLMNSATVHPDLLLRAGFLNSVAYNLDIPGSWEKTSSIFQRLLTAAPGHPSANSSNRYR